MASSAGPYQKFVVAERNFCWDGYRCELHVLGCASTCRNFDCKESCSAGCLAHCCCCRLSSSQLFQHPKCYFGKIEQVSAHSRPFDSSIHIWELVYCLICKGPGTQTVYCSDVVSCRLYGPFYRSVRALYFQGQSAWYSLSGYIWWRAVSAAQLCLSSMRSLCNHPIRASTAGSFS